MFFSMHLPQCHAYTEDPVCNSNTHEFRGRLPRPSTPRNPHDGDRWTHVPATHTDYHAVTYAAVKPHSTKDSNPPSYWEPSAPEPAPLPVPAADQPGASPRVENHSLEASESDATPPRWSLVTFILWLSQNLHLVTMLWIPRYYENQIRHGVLRFDDIAQLDASRSDIRSAYDIALERTEGGVNIDDDEETVTKIRVLWMEFVECRVFEWNILISIALVLIA